MRAITFAKTADGVWLNRETGVRIHRTWQGYHIDRPVNIVMVGTTPFPQGNGGWAPVTDMPCSTLKQAREIGGRIATQIRDEIAAAYDEAMAEERARVEAAALDSWARETNPATVELAHAEAIEEYATRFPRDYARHVIALHAQRKPQRASAERTAIESYLAGDTDELPPEFEAVEREVAIGALYPDIPDEALAMNAGFDLAQRVTAAMHTRGANIAARGLAHVVTSDFTDNVRRYQH